MKSEENSDCVILFYLLMFLGKLLAFVVTLDGNLFLIPFLFITGKNEFLLSLKSKYKV